MGDVGVDRDFRRNLAAVVACGAIVRIIRLATKWNHPLLLNDSLYYAAQAQQLAHGVWFREVFVDQPGAEHGPLTSSLMALVSWGSDPFNRQRMVTVACGIATVAVIGLVGRRVAGNRVGLLAAALAAVYPNLWLSDGLVMSESVSCLLVALALWAILVWADRPTLRAAVLVGVAIGLGTLARSEVVLFVPSSAVVMWIVGRRSAVLAAIAVVTALLVPWTIFNLVRFEKPVFLTTNEGGALLGANCDDSYFGPAQGGWSLLCLVDDPGNGSDADTSVRTARQRHEALSYVRDHLSTLPRVELQRVGRSLDLFALGDMVRGDVGEERERWASWAGIVSFWMLAPLAVAGAFLTRRRDRAILLIPVVIALVTTVVIYGGHRIRSAAEPAIVILAAVAIDRWIGGRIDRQGQFSESVPN
ncbi:MAG: glycosyltransferase family 39 protein [Ilumatobacteraceae bacterium]|nr:glycosyltransferase family 39 protein [Ilumatobacteraceae bacterium]